MDRSRRWSTYGMITSGVLLVVGALDPLEGSMAIFVGAALLAFISYRYKHEYWRTFLLAFALITIGVGLMFYFSSKGGFGENALSWWYAAFIAPYPVGWLIALIMLIKSWTKKPTADVI